MADQPTVPDDTETLERSTIRRISIRLLPFLVLGYLIAYIDRSNVGFASLQMNDDIGLSASAFGLGASVFFLAYVLLEVPSNMALNKVGARLWIARIMITWGILAAGMAFVVGPTSFTVMRFLLGAAEAGFFPGVILYLTFWFPPSYRARVIALFSMAIPLASVLGSPISGYLLGLDGLLGLRGWQWLFIIEGLPAVILGILALFVLPSRPSTAKWLPTAEREWLEAALRAQETVVENHHTPLRKVLLSRKILLLSLVYASTAAISQGLSLWQPQMIKSFGLTNTQIGWVNAIPFAVAVVGMIIWGRISDRRAERVRSTALPIAVSAIALAFVPLIVSLPIFLIVLSTVLIGTYAAKGPFWSLSTEWLSKREAVAGVAMINSLGSLAAFGGNWVIGAIKDHTDSFALAMIPLMILAAVSVITLLIAAYFEGRGKHDNHTPEKVPSTVAH
ncbi:MULTISPECIES: MFS transporter [unclassified Rhodococcus (in: high G+C Gram-positive bacteria)]|uniref:MFS transporter n=1 Tax=unclassified Rhodococcus (in: high G+C Gram-positive bacteria) TaxID=192944 RepID=UPI0002FAC7BC|nr:MFS transporter [Rhodococcus sp. DK17]